MILHAHVKDDGWLPLRVLMPHYPTAPQDDEVGLDECGATGCCLRIMLRAQQSITQGHERQRTRGKTQRFNSTLRKAQH